MKSLLLVALAVCAVPAEGTEDAAKKSVAKTPAATPADAASKEPANADTANADTANADTANADKPETTRVEVNKPVTEKVVALHELETTVAMLIRNNELRQSVGLGAQKISPELTAAAYEHAKYMARTGAFDHYVNGSPLSRAQKHRFFGGVGENIAMGQRNVQGAFRAWRNSSGHWANMTSRHPLVGFGYAVSRSGTPYWVTMYGTPPRKKADGEASDASNNTATTTYSSSNSSNKQGPIRRMVRAAFSRRR